MAALDPLQCLVVENEPLKAHGLARMLSDVGHQVCGLARDVPELADLLANHEPHLIVIDVDLGRGTEGLGLGTVLEATGPLAIVYFAETADEALHQEIRAMEGTALLVKPFTSDRLKRAITIAVARANPEVGLTVESPEEPQS